MSGRLVSLVHKTKITNPLAKAVLAYLADKFNDDTGECFPLISTICRETSGWCASSAGDLGVNSPPAGVRCKSIERGSAASGVSSRPLTFIHL